MENTTGTIVTVATVEHVGVYSSGPHIPFPNTPDVRGIGAKWPWAQQGDDLASNRRSAVLGDAFVFARVGEFHRAVVQ